MTEKSFLDKNSDVDFVCDVLIDALQQRRINLITDLFDLYNKVRKSERSNSINTDPLTGISSISINTTDMSNGYTKYDFSYDGSNYSFGNSPDVISFS